MRKAFPQREQQIESTGTDSVFGECSMGKGQSAGTWMGKASGVQIKREQTGYGGGGCYYSTK